ncbi:DUF2306 domain-containing protein [Rhodanobacter sp. MP7CTX1]|uniref:DUF2306 domain-containing protein n=1 Tax=Rhodanobacter sp. MP7CTX1 TaxID=2723084 RepID=UPI00160E0C5D|nr:putative membrane protein [Rhodanobacter sp. MP7CTX1]
MSPLLIVHVSAGCVGILSGAAALSVRKGERLHRAFGTVFFLSMLTVSALAIYLAIFVPPTAAGGAPPSASVSVGILTIYLVATAWMTVRRKEGCIGRFEKGALLVALGVTAALLIFGLRAASIPMTRPGGYVPYFVFAAFAAFAATGDLRMILRGGISGVRRIARHLWRMCFALFFAASFFFLGQQKVMPVYMHGSPLLLALGIAPLLVMIFWLIRVRFTNWFKDDPHHKADRSLR